MDVLTWIVNHWMEVVGGLISVLSGIIAIALLIPGDQPEKFLQSVVDFLSKFSKK